MVFLSTRSKYIMVEIQRVAYSNLVGFNRSTNFGSEKSTLNVIIPKINHNIYKQNQK